MWTGVRVKDQSGGFRAALVRQSKWGNNRCLQMHRPMRHCAYGSLGSLNSHEMGPFVMPSPSPHTGSPWGFRNSASWGLLPALVMGTWRFGATHSGLAALGTRNSDIFRLLVDYRTLQSSLCIVIKGTCWLEHMVRTNRTERTSAHWMGTPNLGCSESLRFLWKYGMLRLDKQTYYGREN